ncbi:MAG: radical SAM protein, partial [Clostridiales bacterium]|nr:radical SAM protein [Clostridiales bacterium]
TACSFLDKDPEQHAPQLMAWVDTLAGDGPDSFESQRAAVRHVINDPDNNMHQLVMDIMRDTDKDVLKATFQNFFLNANIIGWPIQEKMREKYGCNIPWAILLDPTSACNLHCTGCWAADSGNKLNLSFDEIDSIITQGKELGVYMYIYTGGEPLVRKKDLIALCNKHSDCQFLSFTNGTLIDEEFTDEMLRVKNFIPAISLEGSEEATDGRRGAGTYKKVIHAMELLGEKHLPFGISSCYTSANVDSIASDEYIDSICKMGARFIWYFHYMPVGNDAVPQLLPSPEQREYMYHRIREIRATKPIFAMDFQNDGQYVGGCIAGGRRYLHINANGDVDPCVFIHYSNSNIREHTLLEALQSPIFMAYHDGQPFNDNMLRPCPMLENPDQLRAIVEKTGAHSTDPQSPETADHLCAKCDEYASSWKPTADRLWGCTGDCAACAKKE